MRIRHILIVLSTFALLGASACASGEGAQQEDDKTTRAQTVEPDEEDGHEQPSPRPGADEQIGQETGEDTEQEAEEQEERGERDERRAKRQKMAEMCPMQLEGTTASVEKLDDAVAMNFTTSDDVDELRSRVRTMAESHNKRRGGEGMKKGKMKKKRGKMKKKRGDMKKKRRDKGEKGQMAERREKMMKMKKVMAETTAETEEIERGMRLKLTPDDPEHVDTLHENMKKHSEKMAEKDGCPMMMMKGKEADEESDS